MFKRSKLIFITMAKILYAVCGEGMGHAIRSAVIIKHLLKKNEAIIVSDNKAFDYLSERFENVYKISGYNIVYDNNEVRNLKTLIRAMKSLPGDLKRNLLFLYRSIKEFKPDFILSDFEPFSNMIANFMRIPLISISNQHILTKTKMKLSKNFQSRMITKIVNRLYAVRPKKYLITTFFYPEVKNKKRASLFPPILREEVFSLRPALKDHVLVYQTSKTYEKLVPILKKIVNQKFIVYGLDKNKKERNVIFRKFNEDKFLKELASSKAVITNGGFTLIGEALHLGKPILSVPVRKQYEQTLNAAFVQKLKYGEYHADLSEKAILGFLSNLGVYRESLKKYKRNDNSKILKEIDSLLGNV